MIEITDESFDKEVLQSDIPVLVDFWAPWCGPCRALAPILESLAPAYAGKVKFCKIDTNEYAESAAKYKIMAIPSLLIFKNGQVVQQTLGLKTEAELKKILDNL
jgi:thioredoxin 1